jgi:ABC-2 type transport system permease protein
LSLIALGLTIAASVSSEELVGGVLNLMTWPMMLLSGIWYSLEGSPHWVRLALAGLSAHARAQCRPRGHD